MCPVNDYIDFFAGENALIFLRLSYIVKYVDVAMQLCMFCQRQRYT